VFSKNSLPFCLLFVVVVITFHTGVVLVRLTTPEIFQLGYSFVYLSFRYSFEFSLTNVRLAKCKEVISLGKRKKSPWQNIPYPWGYRFPMALPKKRAFKRRSSSIEEWHIQKDTMSIGICLFILLK
jgi:hypothetical protein